MYSGVCITLQVSLAVQILASSENMKVVPQYHTILHCVCSKKIVPSGKNRTMTTCMTTL